MNHPLRCKSCGSLLAQCYQVYKKKVADQRAGSVPFYSPTTDGESKHRQILNEMGIYNDCCAMAMLTLCNL